MMMKKFLLGTVFPVQTHYVRSFCREFHLNVIHCILRKTSLSICVIKPNPNDLGTCLCSKCLNLELKLEALAKAIQDNCLKWNDKQSYTTIDELIEKIDMIAYDKTTHKWQKIKRAKQYIKSTEKYHCH